MEGMLAKGLLFHEAESGFLTYIPQSSAQFDIRRHWDLSFLKQNLILCSDCP
jgi:hypothetical protein